MRKTARRRHLSLTSLIDVIFLLLLFFMLSSTFTRFSDVDLTRSARAGTPTDAPDAPTHFLQLAEEGLRLNGAAATLQTVAAALRGPDNKAVGRVLVTLAPDTSAQRLTDLLVVLHQIPALTVTVLERG